MSQRVRNKAGYLTLRLSVCSGHLGRPLKEELSRQDDREGAAAWCGENADGQSSQSCYPKEKVAVATGARIKKSKSRRGGGRGVEWKHQGRVGWLQGRDRRACLRACVEQRKIWSEV